jgi:hypothetical protein
MNNSAISKMTKTTAASINQTRNGHFDTQSASRGADINRSSKFK